MPCVMGTARVGLSSGDKSIKNKEKCNEKCLYDEKEKETLNDDEE